MKLICLFGQRKELYLGELVPELLDAIDEYGNDDNPSYMDDKEKEYNGYDDIAFTKRIEIEVDDKRFDEVFYGNASIKGEVKQ